MKISIWRLAPFVIFLMLGFFLWRGLSLDPSHLPSMKVDKPVPNFKLPVLNDPSSYLTPSEFKGKISLLNVWASWCRACIEEQSFLLELSHSGVVIYGFDYKDEPGNAKKWLEEWGNPYKAIGSDISGRAAIDLGVYGAPETFLIDSQGVIRYRHVGVMDETIWERDFKPRISLLE